ncbi:P-loop containing nucleoside triphosphate hydrolase protein [Lipomyces kononenkoae]|uniref:P-loop containing nucleoside triphosphate hydrolase protein n=1 Tax=Lipomyces kononenkoae TaxID=34357 RepID=A0ACC3T7L6_LIPKO
MAATSSPTVAEIYDSNFANAAHANWLADQEQPVEGASEVISGLFSQLEKEGFNAHNLLILDHLLCLEKFLWPCWTSEAKDDHTIFIAIAAVVKQRDHVMDWNLFSNNEELFSNFFQRVLTVSSTNTTPLQIRTYLISFIDAAFQSLDSSLIRRMCAPLVSISVWNFLHSSSTRDDLLNSNSSLKKSWRLATKKFDAADDVRKVRLRIERGWLYSIVLDLVRLLYVEGTDTTAPVIIYAERVLELLIDIISQLPTRRFSNTLLKDLNLSIAIRLSPAYKNEKNILLRQLHEILDRYMKFPIDDLTGVLFSKEELQSQISKQVLRFQKIALDHFKEKLLVLGLANYGSVSKREDLLENLESLTDNELRSLCAHLGIATEYSVPGIPTDKQFMMELLAYKFVRQLSLEEKCEALYPLPTEKSLSSTILQQTSAFDSRTPLPIPRFSLQYLSTNDFLHRAFELYRLESFFEVKCDIESIIDRLKLHHSSGELKLSGFSRMAQRISRPAILETAPARVGESHPAYVRAELYLELDRVNEDIQKEWEALRPGEVVFLVAVQTPNSKAENDLEKIGVKYIRAAEVVGIYDHNSNPVHASGGPQPVSGRKPLYGRLARRRRLHVNIDSMAYSQDSERVYDRINFVFRRHVRENNFKSILDSVKDLTQTNIALPDWLVDVFLGYGDPASASYENLPNRPERVDLNDTFINWGHLTASFDKKVVSVDGTLEGSLPPYVLRETTEIAPPEVPKKTRGRKKKTDAEPVEPTEVPVIEVSTYHLPNMGPYLVDSRKRNKIPFTPAQVKAIYSATNPGLTLIIGPPGTGKTDVATQIISNIYHNNPKQRTLVVTHSNQALNRLFEKIVALDIDERHLLRLGHGEDDLRTEASYSRYGRVENVLDRRETLLKEVTRLSDSVGGQGPHGESCEAAGYFYRVFVLPTWQKFKSNQEFTDAESLSRKFPFQAYFANAPQPLFNPEIHSLEEAMEIADGCFLHLEKIFTELEDIRPFELLRTAKDRANYLLTREAKIIALTSTHAAMRRREIISLGFRYENVIVEEAAQLTEIDSFIPLTLQSTASGKNALERVVLIGDHFQNAPIIQNPAFQNYANMEQSLFSRLLRLSVPSITLDAQGRARPEIAELYSWRYRSAGKRGLTNLPICYENEEYKFANAGFKHVFQFINVDDYNGFGETEPSPHFYQNLGEAEYSVAIYMYMRLLGYPADKISILTPYMGQKVLIQNILAERCKRNPIFGLPLTVATVDQYQGEQNDYIILSLVRTKRIGYLRDVRRMTVAMSRTRLGLYVLGRRYLLESSVEIKLFLEALDANRSEGDKLELSIGEMFPSARASGEIDDSKVVIMDGVEHLGKFVYEMTMRKVEKMREEGTLPAPPTLAQIAAADQAGVVDMDDMDLENAEEDLDEMEEDNMDEEAMDEE